MYMDTKVYGINATKKGMSKWLRMRAGDKKIQMLKTELERKRDISERQESEWK